LKQQKPANEMDRAIRVNEVIFEIWGSKPCLRKAFIVNILIAVVSRTQNKTTFLREIAGISEASITRIDRNGVLEFSQRQCFS
jgi:hypothetical protein